MKAKQEETTWLLDLAGKGSVKAFVQVPMKGIKDKSPDHEPVIRYGKEVGRCLLDGGNGIIHVKQRGDSWGLVN